MNVYLAAAFVKSCRIGNAAVNNGFLQPPPAVHCRGPREGRGSLRHAADHQPPPLLGAAVKQYRNLTAHMMHIHQHNEQSSKTAMGHGDQGPTPCQLAKLL